MHLPVNALDDRAAQPAAGQTMHARFRVRLNIAAICQHLSREEGRSISQDEVVIWLQEAGFTRHPEASRDEWIVSEPDLGQVDPSEVLAIEPLENPDSH
jgi:hypothetical protein